VAAHFENLPDYIFLSLFNDGFGQVFAIIRADNDHLAALVSSW
jgi:hypothetical protein